MIPQSPDSLSPQPNTRANSFPNLSPPNLCVYLDLDDSQEPKLLEAIFRSQSCVMLPGAEMNLLRGRNEIGPQLGRSEWVSQGYAEKHVDYGPHSVRTGRPDARCNQRPVASRLAVPSFLGPKRQLASSPTDMLPARSGAQ